MLDMPEIKKYPDTLEKDYDEFMQMREIVLKALEIARNDKIIGKSLNADLILYPKGKYKALLSRLNVDLKQVFIVSRIEIRTQGEGSYQEEGLSVDVKKADGDVCERCWMVVETLDEDGFRVRERTLMAGIVPAFGL
jgi:isoleucyl-tRNA synthetase